MIYIKLSNTDMVSIIDNEIFEVISKRKWQMNQGGYACCSSSKGNGKRGVNLLAHWVLNAKKGQFIDHINGNKLDNRKQNLRFCTLKQNGGNRTCHTLNKSGYKGVTLDKHGKKWQVYVAGKYGGVFKSAKNAAKKYNELAIKEWGDFARLNEV